MTATKRVARFRSQIETAPGVWTTIRRVRSLDLPPVVAEFADSSGFENDGFGSQEVVAGSWTATIGILVGMDGAGVALTEHEYIRLAAFAMFGNAARLHYRFFDKNGGAEAFDGFAFTAFKYDSGDWKGLATATITLNGDGPLTVISNPASGSLVPTVISATPSAQTAGNQVVIAGNQFTGVTGAAGVTFNAVSVGVGKYTVLSDNLIVATMPAGTAGAGNIVVTNGAGASTALPYTRGA